MVLLFDIGNTHTHLGLGDRNRVRKRVDMPTSAWFDRAGARSVAKFAGDARVEGVCLCSVVPRATPWAGRWAARRKLPLLELNARTIRGIGIDYPEPDTIGPDRLANAVASDQHYGAPSVVVDFGTAVTFDVINRRRQYVGGIIAPGLAAMTEYLHEKTALLPRIQIREVAAVIGKNTEEAMMIGAVRGYRGLVRQLISELKDALACPKLPVVATGGYAQLIAENVPEITAVDPLLTLEGLRLSWYR